MASPSASKTRILDIETANPPNRLTQREVLEVLLAQARLSARAAELYKRFLLDDGIHSRYFAWDDPQVLLGESPDEKMKRFERAAVTLSVEAARKILKKEHGAAQRIDAVFVCTCTGYLCPGLSTYVSQQLGLPEYVHTLDLVGLGCSGALPALRAADDYLKGSPDSSVLVVAVEICSAATHWKERPELILSNAIFSDGAAAVLLSNRAEHPGLRITKFSSILRPQFRDDLRFTYLESRLCNVISSKVPGIVAHVLSELCGNHLSHKRHYAFHSGGRKVLDEVQLKLGLSDEDMRPSRQVLRDYGNMSSPSVLFVLKVILGGQLRNQEAVTCFSFGAGFLACMLQAEWCS